MTKLAIALFFACAGGLPAFGQSPRIPVSEVEFASRTMREADVGASMATAGTAASPAPIPLRARTDKSLNFAATQPGIVYTCDPGIDADVCTTLNTTISGLYASIFTNAAANIYVKFGPTSLGESQFFLSAFNYTRFRDALQSTLASADDATAFASSVPPVNPIDSADLVRLTSPLARALSIAPGSIFPGIQTDGQTSCPLDGSSGCYDGLITISQALFNAGRLYFRTGSIGFNQYDFYSVVQHETDEILGTPSCAFGCTNRIFPTDLFRYQSNGTRGFAPGNNVPCSTAFAGNACFSLDGVKMLQQFNNLNNGEDAGDWIPACPLMLVQNAAACQGIANVDISPAAEIRLLDVIGYTINPNVVSPVNALTSNAPLHSGTCAAPAAVADFTTVSPWVLAYASVTGAQVGDTAQTVFIRPDGVTYGSPLTTTISSVGPKGAACFEQQLFISGTPAAAFRGTWTILVYWNQSATPLFKLSFRLSFSVCTYGFSPAAQTITATGGTAVFSLDAPPGCAWTLSGIPSWITPSPTGPSSGSQSVLLTAAPNSGPFQQATISAGGATASIEQGSLNIPGLVPVGSLAHVTSGGGWTFTLNAVNLGSSPAVARFNFGGELGDQLVLPWTFLQSSTPTAPLTAYTFDRSLNANAQLAIESTSPNSPAVAVGSGEVLANDKVNGFGIFSDPVFGWNAAVPLETRDASSYILAFDNTGALTTGVAVANITTNAANIPVVIRDDTGAQIGTSIISLAPQGHTSFMLNQYAFTAGKRGTVEFDTPAGGQISVLGLRANGPALTTLPVLARSDPPGGGTIAHVTYNGGFTSIFYLVNTGTSFAQFTLSFYDEAGNALPVPLLFPQSGVALTSSLLTQTLAAGATLVVETQANASLPSVSGSAQLTTMESIRGFEIFDWTTFGQEASVPLETRTPNSFLLIYDDTNGLTTGVALANVASTAANIGVNIYDDTGTLLQTTNVSVPGRGHIAFMLPDKYAQTANGRGMVEFLTPQSGRISAIGLRATPTGTLTTIPVLAR